MWSVAYNPQEPTLFASGSDDCTVKLWSMGQPNSIFSFSAKANICSVKFNPYSRYLLAYGSAGVHIYRPLTCQSVCSDLLLQIMACTTWTCAAPTNHCWSYRATRKLSPTSIS